MALNPLRPGDRIALVAPASTFPREKFTAACNLLSDKGFDLSVGEHLLRQKGYLAGADFERAQDLIRAISDPTVAAVVCVRGGYGSGRLLPWLPFSALKKSPKIFLGFSDVTFLHLAFASQMKWITFHGPNLIGTVDFSDSFDAIVRALSGQSSFSWSLERTQVLRHGVASGKLAGGNLTCLGNLTGSSYLPDLNNALLLVEDSGEALYRLDRTFTQLKLAGVLARLGGLILGDFNNCGAVQDIHAMVMEHVEPYRYPVISNLPFGHGSENQVIPLGVPFQMNTHEASFKAMQNPFSE